LLYNQDARKIDYTWEHVSKNIERHLKSLDFVIISLEKEKSVNRSKKQ